MNTGTRRCWTACGQRLLGAGPVHVAADDEHRALGPGDELGQSGDRVRIGLGTTASSRVDRRDVAGRRAEHVEREVQEDRAPMRRRGEGDGLVDERAGLLGVEDRAGRLRDRGEDRHVIELLQRARAPAQLRGPAAEHDERSAVEPGRCDGRDPVGDAGTSGQRGHGRTPGQLGVGLGGERRRLLMTGVEHAHALVAARLVQRPDVTAVQGEHHVDPERPHRRDRLLAGVPVDALRGCAHDAPSDRSGRSLTQRDRNGT